MDVPKAPYQQPLDRATQYTEIFNYFRHKEELCLKLFGLVLALNGLLFTAWSTKDSHLIIPVLGVFGNVGFWVIRDSIVKTVDFCLKRLKVLEQEQGGFFCEFLIRERSIRAKFGFSGFYSGLILVWIVLCLRQMA